ncbi:MAG: rhomboid family intramembrane serine protease [Candidatus Nanohaloarchaea archaeon]
MAECSECGRKSMSFECRYCGKKYCSEHRLPENHDCDSMEEELEKEKEESGNWFRDKETKEETERRTRDSGRKRRKPSLLGDIADTFRSSATLTIIALTVVSFVAQFTVPGYVANTILRPEISHLVTHPWTLVTVMLLHGGPFHLFANMVTFYFFGSLLEKVVGSRDLLKFYVGSGIAASISFVAFRNLLALPFMTGPQALGPAVGASGAVVACFAAVAMLYPDAEVLLYFFIPMKIKTALHAFVAIEGFNLLMKTIGIYLPVIGGFASSAHLAGIAAGVWFGRKLREQHSKRIGVLDMMNY